jgi:hypothetical protein
MRARGLESPDRADALIGAIMLSLGVGGGISRRDIAGIKFGLRGGLLYFGEPFQFGEEQPESEPDLDVSRVARYPFWK